MEGEERRELPLFPQKSKLCALSQPLDNAFGILLLVSSDVLRKEDNRENFKKMGHFLSLRQIAYCISKSKFKKRNNPSFSLSSHPKTIMH